MTYRTISPYQDCRQIELTKGHSAIVDEDMHALLSSYKWYARNCNGVVYAVTWSGERMHRLIVGAPSSLVVDHINGNTLDNRFCNLRLCSRSENAMNQKCRANKRSVYKGVVIRNRLPGQFVAEIRVKGRKIHLGTFDSDKDAARAYDDAAKRFFGDYARINDI